MKLVKEDGNIYYENDGIIIGKVTFSKIDKNTYNINHTFVDEKYRGKGIASKLVEEAFKYIKDKGCNVTASCSYAKDWLEKNKTVVFASNNKHKIVEVKDILKDYNVLSLNDIGFKDDIIEDGKTIEENSLIKAKAVHEYLKNKKLNYIVLADDTGLCINSLNGEPGVLSARYAGDHDDQKNRNKVLEKLKGKDRSAYFKCVITVMYTDGTYKSFEGITEGKITEKEIGDTSFGYDAIFYSNDLNKTFGEATSDEKNSVSHRGRALKNMLKNM